MIEERHWDLDSVDFSVKTMPRVPQEGRDFLPVVDSPAYEYERDQGDDECSRAHIFTVYFLAISADI